MTAYETQLKALEEERDRFRRELSKYKRSSREKVLQSIDWRFCELFPSYVSQDLDESQIGKLIREKEDLQLLLNKFERHMAEV